MSDVAACESALGAATRRTLLGAGLASCAAGAFSPPATAQPSQSDIDAIAERAMTTGHMPGMALSVSVGGETRLARGYGFANLDYSATVTGDTLFHAGSIGKQFTAYAILQLAEAGEVDLAAPIARYLDVPEAWRAARVLHLLHHTSGIPDYVNESFVWDRPLAHADMIALAGEELHFAPGDSWSYCNTGYALLGGVVEKQSGGQSYTDFVRQRILAPLGMRRSRPDDPAAVIEGRAEPYDDVDGVFRRSVRMETGVASSADGGLLLSVREFPIWMNEMRRPTLVSPAHARLLFTPTRLNTGRIYPWGMAWLVDQVRGRPLYAMGGEGPGFFARMQWSPHADTSVFNCTNTSSGSAPPHLGYCGLQVMEMFAPGATPVSLAPIRDRRPARTEEAFAILTRGENPINAERLASELRIKSGGPLAGEIASTSRTVRSLTLVEEYTMGGVAVRRYRLNYDDANNLNHLRVGYAPDGRICWFGVVLG